MTSPAGASDAAASDVVPSSRARLRDRLVSVLPFVILAVAAVSVRATLFPIETIDVRDALAGWFTHLRDHGHFAALKDNVGNYPPSYLYFLALTSYLRVAPIVGIKIIPVAFDVALACAFLSIVADRTASQWGRIVAFALPLFSPTLVINGSAWGQCDVMYTTFVVLSLRSALRDDWRRAMALAGAAMSFKLQAIFFLPALGLMFLKARGPWRALPWAPVVFVATMLPALAIGRPLHDLVTLYTGQVGLFHSLSLGGANFYQWIPNAPFAILRVTGIVLTLSLLVFIACISWLSPVQWRGRERVLLALLTCILCPFFLPEMHERYFLSADVISLLLPFFMPRRWWIPILVVNASALCCLPFMFGQQPVEFKWPALMMGVALFRVAGDWIRAQGLPPIVRADATS
ncbi:MAG TPA: glycosyltransferase 87 family protein [Polyangia bacterium]|jgi:Gpi18-like mannosyltransferase|nr:glycosyltransferase 87 family protein [Polyangia bacterium]